MTRMPWCRSCQMPIICTFLIRSKEYYCVGCGRSWAWFAEPRDDETPERIAELKRLSVEFEAVTKDIIVGGSRLNSCERCRESDHDVHATDEERVASNAAWEKLKAMQRVTA